MYVFFFFALHWQIWGFKCLFSLLVNNSRPISYHFIFFFGTDCSLKCCCKVVKRDTFKSGLFGFFFLRFFFCLFFIDFYMLASSTDHRTDSFIYLMFNKPVFFLLRLYKPYQILSSEIFKYFGPFFFFSFFFLLLFRKRKGGKNPVRF